MKKAALILLTVVYMLSTAGVAISQVYCCSKLQETKFSLSSTEYKAHKNGTKDDGCCKTTHQYYKVKDSHIATGDVLLPEKYFSNIHTAFPEFELITPEQQKVLITNNINAPPLISGNPIYIFNCTYRI